jgi:hypothetical protein
LAGMCDIAAVNRFVGAGFLLELIRRFTVFV